MDKFVVTKSFEIPLYFGRLAILFADSDITIADYYKDCEDNWKLKYGHTYRVNEEVDGKSTRAYLVAFHLKNSYSNLTHGVISHEALHAVNMILDFAGVEPCDKSEEAYAYLMTWVVDSIYSVVKSDKFIESNIF